MLEVKVQTCHCSFFPPLFPLKCVCPLLWWKRVFQEQPNLSKLALKAAGHKKRHGSLLASVCVCRGGVAKPKTRCVTWFHISENAYGKMTGKWVTPSSHIDSLQDWETEHVIVSFKLTQNKWQMMDGSWQWWWGAYHSVGELVLKAWWTSVKNGNICVCTKHSVEQQSASLSKPFSPLSKNTHQPPED